MDESHARDFKLDSQIMITFATSMYIVKSHVYIHMQLRSSQPSERSQSTALRLYA
jgi:hypothetical protein